MKEKDIRKKEEELREYQKKSFASRAAAAVITLAVAGIAGYLGKKGRPSRPAPDGGRAKDSG